MNNRQKTFVKEYLLSKNATQAAIASGYSAKSASSIGEENMRKPEIKAAIDAGLLEQQQELERRAQRWLCTKERWLQELSMIAFADMDDFATIEANGIRLVRTEDRDKGLGRVIKKLSESTSQHGGSQAIELQPKIPALEMLGKHFGWLKDTIEHSGGIDTRGNRKGQLQEIFKTDKSRALALELAEEMCEQEEKGEADGEDSDKGLP